MSLNEFAEKTEEAEEDSKEAPNVHCPSSPASWKEVSPVSRKHHIKKPLNAFMVFMKVNRAKLKGFQKGQSAELNKEMGRMWQLLTSDQQQKYYTMATEERIRHQEKFPGWSSRDNYASAWHRRKRKRKVDPESLGIKKCRARFGLDNSEQWCKFCKRKKKCLWFRKGLLSDPTSHKPPS